MDALLTALEELNLQGARRIPDGLQAEVAEALGLDGKAPRSPVHAHEAVLDAQEEVLEARWPRLRAMERLGPGDQPGPCQKETF